MVSARNPSIALTLTYRADRSPSLPSGPVSAYAEDSLARTREDWKRKFPSRAPSSQGRPKTFAADQKKTPPEFYFNRPPSAAATVPITLYNAVFAKFQEDCETYTPTKEDHAFVLKLSVSMSKFYDTEEERAAQARSDMGTYDLDFLAAKLRSYATDGDMRWKEFCYAILEYKLEMCSGGAEALFQAGWYYTAFMRDLLAANRSCHFPCFILYAFGGLFYILNEECRC